ncbi:MAG: hypothetical protein ACI91O_000391 [Candidatus Poriferisodalaceae bacterium]
MGHDVAMAAASENPVPNQPVPDVPVPDVKDWTWVLDAQCAECGFEAGSFERDELGDLLRENVVAWSELLRGDETSLKVRPQPAVCPPLEYSCHVRDVFALYQVRLDLMLNEDDARYANWDQDVTAIEQRYDLAVADKVRAALEPAGAQLAASFDAVAGDQWDRTGFLSDGARFMIETFGRYLLHDPVHHLHDAGWG